MKVGLTYWPELTRPVGRRVSTTWAKVCERLSVPREILVVDHACSTDCARCAEVKARLAGFAFATFANNHRRLANVEAVYAIGLDFDADCEWEATRRLFANVDAFGHTTWSSTMFATRARVFLRLSRPVTADEYRIVFAQVRGVAQEGGLLVDRQASDPSRLWYLPAVKLGQAYRYFFGKGNAVNVDAAIAKAKREADVVDAAPREVAPREPSRPSGPTDYDRARRYISRCDGAIAGSGGHRVTFDIAQRLVRGFGLAPDDALVLLSEWNQRCQPPWSERDLKRKVEQAVTMGRMPEGRYAR